MTEDQQYDFVFRYRTKLGDHRGLLVIEAVDLNTAKAKLQSSGMLEGVKVIRVDLPSGARGFRRNGGW